MSKVEELLKLMKDNPDLPIVPMVNFEVVGDEFSYWMGSWGRSEVGEYYIGEERERKGNLQKSEIDRPISVRLRFIRNGVFNIM